MEALVETRRILILLNYLKSHITVKTKGSRKLSDDGLAKILNGAAGEDFLSGSQVNGIMHPRILPDAALRRKLLRAIEKAIKDNKLGLDVRTPFPKEIEDDCVNELPDPLQHLDSAPFVGHGRLPEDLAPLLEGAWQFFYVSPVDRNGDQNPEVRGSLVVFLPWEIGSHSIQLKMISSRAVWEGSAIIIGHHMYINCYVEGESEGAFFLMSHPEGKEPSIAGLGIALDRTIKKTIAPAMSVVCFGEKVQCEEDPDSPPHLRALTRVLRGTAPEAGDIDSIREHFCRRLENIADIARDHPRLSAYLQSLKLNHGEMDMRWLHLYWP